MLNALIHASLPDLEEWLPWTHPPPTQEESERFACQTYAQFMEREKFGFLVTAGETPIGVIGLQSIHWSVPLMAIGYWRGSAYAGQGYFTEALRGIIKFAFEELNAERLVIRCDSLNHRSARLAERGGFTAESIARQDHRHVVTGQLRDTKTYALLRVEWLQQNGG